MPTSAKELDWVPLYIQRLIASDAWKLLDFQFGWYLKLLVIAADRGGYLPGSVSELWQIAGAKSESYFVRWGGPELVSRYFRRTDDGTNRIYNPRMLEVIGRQSKKLSATRKQKTSLSLSVLELGSFTEAAKRLFAHYAQKFNRKSTYTLTEKREKKCVARLHEVMTTEACDLSMAEQIARVAIDNLAASAWHIENGHIDWIDQIFRSQEEFQKRVEMRPSDGLTEKERRIQAEARVGYARGQFAEFWNCWGCNAQVKVGEGYNEIFCSKECSDRHEMALERKRLAAKAK